MKLDTVTGEIPCWRKVPADKYAEWCFPAKPRAIRKMAIALRKLGAEHDGPFTIHQYKLAKLADVPVRTWQRWLPLFEKWGVIEVKRWRYRHFGACPNTYLVFLGQGIPDNWRETKPPFRVSPRDTL